MNTRKRHAVDFEAEIAHLHRFIRVLAHKLADANEVLGRLAERRRPKEEVISVVKLLNRNLCSTCHWQWLGGNVCPACGKEINA